MCNLKSNGLFDLMFLLSMIFCSAFELFGAKIAVGNLISRLKSLLPQFTPFVCKVLSVLFPYVSISLSVRYLSQGSHLVSTYDWLQSCLVMNLPILEEQLRFHHVDFLISSNKVQVI